MAKIKMKTEDGEIRVESPYNASWVRRARQLGGTWKAPYWCFKEEHEELVAAALEEIFGENGLTPAEKVMVDITLPEDHDYGREIVVAGLVIARRKTRDSDVALENGAILVSGAFPGSGGSHANPRIGYPKREAIIRVSIPKAKLEEVRADWDVSVVTRTPSREALEAEKAALKARLEEIERLLAEYA